MNKLMTAALGTLVWMLGSAYGQNLDTIKVHLPYAAVVNGTDLPAGDYTVQVLDTAGSIPLLRFASDIGIRAAAAANYLPAVENPKDESHIVLVRRGDHYQIDRVWIGDVGYELLSGK